MTHKDFFNWLRQQQDDNKLTQGEVDAANGLLETIEPHILKQYLTELNDWHDGMQLSEKGLDIIKDFEGFMSKPYRDAVGVWTIGYGNTYYLDGRKVSGKDKPLTKAEASKLKLDIINKDFVPAINMIFADEIKAGKINQNMFDAMVSLAYNIGVGAFSRSSVVRYIKRGDYDAAAASFELWVKAGGKKLKGLVNRRKEEKALFLS